MKLSDNVALELKFPDDRIETIPRRRLRDEIGDNEAEFGLKLKF